MPYPSPKNEGFPIRSLLLCEIIRIEWKRSPHINEALIKLIFVAVV